MAADYLWRRGFLASLVLGVLPTCALAQDEVTFHVEDAAEPAAAEFHAASYPAYGPYDVMGNYSQSFGEAESGDDCCPQWSFLFTQTADYGTSLALPIT